MPKTQQRLQKSEGISLSDLDRYSQSRILESEIRQHSAATVSNRKLFVKNLLWFLRQREYPHCGTLELRQFLAYVTNGHKEPGGRWGSARQNQPVRPRTVKDYYTNLRTLFNWIVAEDGCEVSPLSSIQTPIARADHIEPFTTDQVKALYNAAKRGRHPRRDETIIPIHTVDEFGRYKLLSRSFPKPDLRLIVYQTISSDFLLLSSSSKTSFSPCDTRVSTS